jgi:putative transposase
LFGITRQAYYQYFWREGDYQLEEELLLQEVRNIRKRQPMIGTRKLYGMLAVFMIEHQIKIGRDALFDLLARNCMLVKRKKRKVQTTFSAHWLRKYANLIKNFVPTKPNELWVADITYLETEEGFLYISLITDAYSRKIVGYHVADNLLAVSSAKALKMAIENMPKNLENLIHHRSGDPV